MTSSELLHVYEHHEGKPSSPFEKARILFEIFEGMTAGLGIRTGIYGIIRIYRVLDFFYA